MILGNKKLLARLDELRSEISADTQSSADEALKRLDGLHDSVGKHDMAIQDMLDSWEEWQDSLKDAMERLIGAAGLRREIDTALERENRLLSAMIAYHDQMYALRRATAGSPWERQIHMVEEKTAPMRADCGLQVIDAVGESYNYALHDVAGVVEAGTPADNMRIADVYTCGYIYCGKVVRKAGVAVYQYKGTSD